VVSKLKILLPKEMETIYTVIVKKFEFRRVVFYQLLQKFKDNNIPLKERERILWFMDEQHEEKMNKKRWKVGESRSISQNKILPKIEILL